MSGPLSFTHSRLSRCIQTVDLVIWYFKEEFSSVGPSSTVVPSLRAVSHLIMCLDFAYSESRYDLEAKMKSDRESIYP